ncbi:hypothetical protein GQ43DRAFT_432639 [Delitschia confertaspora ATCC 74209]|uniref:Uncharacterized protein n=1 Tax=Delitschia confertaspora ATCC 74209 TaxID=1513339 RepID=A0A9P4MRU7_9PLEO|nr:hypothetical protein GQ43DRAFT_432639 [Delitschia confertaspora ATCC 74209]
MQTYPSRRFTTLFPSSWAIFNHENSREYRVEDTALSPPEKDIKGPVGRTEHLWQAPLTDNIAYRCLTSPRPRHIISAAWWAETTKSLTILRNPPRRYSSWTCCPSPLTALIWMGVILSAAVEASPFPQAIPDETGNTGNVRVPCPAPCNLRPNATTISLSSVPSVTVEPLPSISTSASSFNENPESAPSTVATQNPIPSQNPTPTPDLNTNPQPPDQTFQNPNNTAALLTLTTPKLLLPTGAVAGIVAGALSLVLLLVLLILWLRRRHHIDIKEISIRRNRLGSRLGFSKFGGDLGDGDIDSGVKKVHGDKQRGVETSGWREKGLLSVPKPGFLAKHESKTATVWLNKESIGRPQVGLVRLHKEQDSRVGRNKGSVRRDASDAAVDKGMISAPRPARPASAESLGRLSGIGWEEVLFF